MDLSRPFKVKEASGKVMWVLGTQKRMAEEEYVVYIVAEENGRIRYIDSLGGFTFLGWE